MRPVGLIGGIVWPSTMEYYQAINHAVNDAYGDNTNPPLVVYTVNHHRMHQARQSGHWDDYAALLVEAAMMLKKAGVEALVICSNTAHKVAEQVARQSGLKVLHIGEATGRAVRKAGFTRVGLLGTQFTMNEPFLRENLHTEYGVETLVPATREARAEVSRIIDDELASGRVQPTSKQFVLGQIEALRALGAQAVILGCTELDLLIHSEEVPISVFDSTALHAQMPVDYILRRDPAP
jgi:aspartate racemase